MTQRSALIVGAGIGGLTTAISLARSGWQVQVAEKAHRLEPVGAGLQISPNASRIMDELGLLPRLQEFAVEIERLNIRSGKDGAQIGGLTYGKTARERWGAPALVIHRGDLQNVLFDAASGDPNIRINLGLQLDEMHFQENKTVAVLSKYGNETRASADLIVGADGVWSRVRNSIGLTGPINFTGCVAWRTVVPASAVPAFAREYNSNLWLGPGAHVVHYPIRGGRDVNLVAIVEDSWRERGWSEPGQLAWINRRFDGWHKDLRDLIHSAEGWMRWSLFNRPPEWRWNRANTTLLGDAAHPMLPFMAQGAAQAIEDARVLREALQIEAFVPKALELYQRARLKRSADIQRLSQRQKAIYHASGPLAFARNLTLSFLGDKGLTRRHEWIYAHDAAKEFA